MIKIDTVMRSNSGFAPISDFVGPINDTNYIEGAIIIVANNKEILGKDTCDYVDQLWAYLIDALPDIERGRSCSIYFPDQPISVSFVGSGGEKSLIGIKIPGVSERSSVVNRRDLSNEIKAAAIKFLMKMKELTPELEAHWESLRQQISK